MRFGRLFIVMIYELIRENHKNIIINIKFFKRKLKYDDFYDYPFCNI